MEKENKKTLTTTLEIEIDLIVVRFKYTVMEKA